MVLVSSWEQKGIEKGIEKGTRAGKESLVVRMLQEKFDMVSTQIRGRLEQLSSEQLDDLGVALLNITSLKELEFWLTQHYSSGE